MFQFGWRIVHLSEMKRKQRYARANIGRRDTCPARAALQAWSLRSERKKLRGELHFTNSLYLA